MTNKLAEREHTWLTMDTARAHSLLSNCRTSSPARVMRPFVGWSQENIYVSTIDGILALLKAQNHILSIINYVRSEKIATYSSNPVRTLSAHILNPNTSWMYMCIQYPTNAELSKPLETCKQYRRRSPKEVLYALQKHTHTSPVGHNGSHIFLG